MAEYIVVDVPDYKDRVCFDCERDACVEVGCPHAPTAVTARPMERIVRCRDCIHSIRNGTFCTHGRFTLRETSFDRVYVKPYGYCAWGERRTDA